jgi:hypothetical protein
MTAKTAKNTKGETLIDIQKLFCFGMVFMIAIMFISPTETLSCLKTVPKAIPKKSKNEDVKKATNGKLSPNQFNPDVEEA